MKKANLKAQWYVNGQLDKTAPKGITIMENASGAGLSISHIPDGGWPPGKHYVVLIMNEEEVGRYEFTVEETSLKPFEDPDGLFTFRLPADFELISKETEEGRHYIFSVPDKTSFVYVYFALTGKLISDEEWEDFTEGYNVAGLGPFKEDTVELSRRTGGPGNHFLLLEVESKEADAHALVWVQEANGAMTVLLMYSRIALWPDRGADFGRVLDSFTWWPEAVHALLGGE